MKEIDKERNKEIKINKMSSLLNMLTPMELKNEKNMKNIITPGSIPGSRSTEFMNEGYSDSVPVLVCGERLFGKDLLKDPFKDSAFNDYTIKDEFLNTGGLSEFNDSNYNFDINSNLLSSILESNSNDNSPMFDEIIIDNKDPNSNLDWINLFEDDVLTNNDDLDNSNLFNDDILINQLPIEDEKRDVEPKLKKSLDVEEQDFNKLGSFQKTNLSESASFESDFNQSSFQKPDFNQSSFQSQLFTPNDSSTLPTPLINTFKPLEVSKKRKVSITPSSPMIKMEDEGADPIAFKRARNTEAARRSRARKLEKMNVLEDKVSDLKNENEKLNLELLRLRNLLKLNNIDFK